MAMRACAEDSNACNAGGCLLCASLASAMHDVLWPCEDPLLCVLQAVPLQAVP